MTAEYIHCNLLTSINLVCKGRIIMLCLRDAMQNIFIFLYLIVSGGKKKIPVTGMTVLIKQCFYLFSLQSFLSRYDLGVT